MSIDLADYPEADVRRIGKDSYELSLIGYDDTALAEQLNVDDVELVTACREAYHKTRASMPSKSHARTKAIARAEKDLTELQKWQGRLDVAYQIGVVDIVDACKVAALLVKTKTTVGIRYARYLDLDAPLKLDIGAESQADKELQAAYAEFTAATELDAPLS